MNEQMVILFKQRLAEMDTRLAGLAAKFILTEKEKIAMRGSSDGKVYCMDVLLLLERLFGRNCLDKAIEPVTPMTEEQRSKAANQLASAS